MVLGKTFRVWKKSHPRSVLLECKSIDETLLFESGAIAVLNPEECEHIKKQYSKVTDAHACLGVLTLNLGSRHVKYLFLVTGCSSVGRLFGSEIQRVTDVFTLFLEDSVDLDYVSEVRKLLCSGTFYFTSPVAAMDMSATASSAEFESDVVDLSLGAQCRYQGHSLDERFIWNQSLHYLPQQYGVDTSRWLVRISCGSVEVRTVYAGSNKAKVAVISRLSCSRAGTRFNVRGVDDYGEVANFVESELVISYQKTLVAFTQLRGSIPLFWEQPGFQSGAHKVKMSRGPEACRPAFRRHVDALRSRYGSQLFVSLLNVKEGELLLSTALQDQVKDYGLEKSDLDIVIFDYHHQCRGGSQEKLTSVLLREVGPHLEKHGFFCYSDGKVKRLQEGSVRTNCMDCLDRTNAVQTFLAVEVLKELIVALGIDSKASMLSRFQEVLREIWKINGDNISKSYAGTGAMEGKAKMGKLKDGAKSVARTVRNNFLDGSKQEAIDILLTGNAYVGDLGGRARALLSREDALGTSALKAHLCDRHEDFVERTPLRVSVGTWNVNGGRQFRSIAYKNQSMHDWLLDAPLLDARGQPPPFANFTGPMRHPRTKDERAAYRESKKKESLPFELMDEKIDPHIFAIGFEELVDLNAANIVSTSSSNKKEWGSELQRVVSRDQEYALLTCEQLVGVCLYVFIQPHLLPHVRDVAIDSVKTGMHGKAGNKGGVAIRFLLYSTSFCFVCAHLAAGQGHTLERAADYADISKRLSFPMGRGVESHDYVFWCGDFNYRIDLPIEDVKELIENRNFEPLQKADQLRKQMRDAKVFPGFTEGLLDFVPTYKYDLFSDDFDTSEKNRIPAWTDRVLWKHRTHPSYVEMVNSDQGEVDVSYSVGESEDKGSVSSSLGSSSNEPACLSNHANLVYYGRAELRTSDHRPVIAVMDVEVEKVKLSQRNSVREKVVEQLGPADPTIIVHPRANAELDVELLTAAAEEYGIVVLIRLVGEDAYITFHDSRAALRSLILTGTKIGECVVDVCLRADFTVAFGPGSLLDATVPEMPLSVLPPSPSPLSQDVASQPLKPTNSQAGNPQTLRLYSASLEDDFAATPGTSPSRESVFSEQPVAWDAAEREAPAEMPRCVEPSSPSCSSSSEPASLCTNDICDDVAEASASSAALIPPPIPPTSRSISPLVMSNASSAPSSRQSPEMEVPAEDAATDITSDIDVPVAEDSYLPDSCSSPEAGGHVDDADAEVECVGFVDVNLDADESESTAPRENGDGEEGGLPTKSILDTLDLSENAPSRPQRPPTQPPRPAHPSRPSQPPRLGQLLPTKPAQPCRPTRPRAQAKVPSASSLPGSTESKASSPVARPTAPPSRPKAPPSRPDAPPSRSGGPPSRSGPPARPAGAPSRPRALSGAVTGKEKGESSAPPRPSRPDGHPNRAH